MDFEHFATTILTKLGQWGWARFVIPIGTCVMKFTHRGSTYHMTWSILRPQSKDSYFVFPVLFLGRQIIIYNRRPSRCIIIQILHGYPFIDLLTLPELWCYNCVGWQHKFLWSATYINLSIKYCEINKRGPQDVSYNITHHASISLKRHLEMKPVSFKTFYRFLDSHDELLVDQQMYLALDNHCRNFIQ